METNPGGLLRCMHETAMLLKSVARDRREPGRRDKIRLEDKINRAVLKKFKEQRRQIREEIESRYPDRKVTLTGGIQASHASGGMPAPLAREGEMSHASPRDPRLDHATISDIPIKNAFEEDPDFDEVIVKLILKGARGGVGLFSQAVTIGMDWSGTNERAAKWARGYGFDLVKGINRATEAVLREALIDFVNSPGMTIGDVMDRLPFDEQRSMMIAVTETTRAYTQGQLLAGKDLMKEFPDVRIVKQYFTNRDEIVCEFCAEQDGKEIDLDEDFGNGEPPVHPNCRCWISVRTRIGDE